MKTKTAIDKEKFTHIGMDIEKSQAITRPGTTYLKDAWRRFRQNKIAMLGLAIIIIFILMAIVGNSMVPYPYYDNNVAIRDQGPSRAHWFGTDTLGRDIWARIWFGARVSLFIGFMAAFMEGIIGAFLGGMSAYFGGIFDMLLMRFIDIMIALPPMIIIILIMVYMGAGILPIILSFAITGWFGMARLVRGQVLRLRQEEFVLAARSLGAGPLRLITKHLIPNTIGIIIVSLSFSIPRAIFTESFLSFVGLGVKSPLTSWGQMAGIAADAMQTFPYQMIIPSIFICLTMLSFQFIGDGLRDALDPRMR